MRELREEGGAPRFFPDRLIRELQDMEKFADLLGRLGGRFAGELGIDLKAGPGERQKWFLAAILYGARISGTLAARTYRVFAARGLYAPEAILAQGWDNLVALLDEGGYARYDLQDRHQAPQGDGVVAGEVPGRPGAPPGRGRGR